MGPTAGLDRCGKSLPTGIRSPGRPARSQSLYRLSYRANIRINNEGSKELSKSAISSKNTGSFTVFDAMSIYSFQNTIYVSSLKIMIRYTLKNTQNSSFSK